LTSNKDPSFKVPSPFTKFYLSFFLFKFSWNLSSMLQILLRCVTFLARVLDASFLGMGKFVFSSPSVSFWTILLMFETRTCYIIGRIGHLCLYPRLVDLLGLQRQCILLLFRPWSMFAPR
jgi:hypothetical protein